MPPSTSPSSRASASNPSAVIIRPSSLLDRDDKRPTVFLAGPTSSQRNPDWRARLCTTLADVPIQLLNPKNTLWDSTWREDPSDARWAAQVDWEMSMRAEADVAVFFFEAGTDAPVSLLELGLSLGARSSRVLVFASTDYSKKGYVTAACDQFGTKVWDDEEAFFTFLKEALRIMCHRRLSTDTP